MPSHKFVPRARSGRFQSFLQAIELLALTVALAFPAAAAAGIQAIPGQTAYDAGQQVRVRVLFNSNEFASRKLRIEAAVRYEGSTRDIYSPHVLTSSFTPSSSQTATPFQQLWKIPDSAATGRYDISLILKDASSGETLQTVSDAGAFVVYRKLVKIESIQLNKNIYTSGDPVSCHIVLENMTSRTLSHLRLEFSDRYWPWIAGPAAAAAASVVPLETDLTLKPGEQRTIASPKVAVAPEVKRPSVHQYGVVVWNHSRNTVLDIAFSSMAFVNPPGVDSPKPYPRQYVYPFLSDVNTTSYRHFYPSTLDFAAIKIDSSHTMYEPGSTVRVQFQVQNPTAKVWTGVSLVARLLGPQGEEIQRHVVPHDLSFAPKAGPLSEETSFNLPPGKSGLYKVEISVVDSGANPLASNTLELGVNPLPKSILIFCAHEDDEGGWMPLIQAAVENHIPVHLVYITGGDAGSCDIYYEHSCTPADAINFGALRMDETRATLGHIGLPASDIDFLGFPDGGSGEIWYDHKTASNPFLDPVLACDHAPYADIVQPNLSYARDSVVAVAKELIKKFDPQVLITAHPPSEGHIDHIVNGYIAIRALQELVEEGTFSPGQVKVLVDRIYFAKGAPYTPYHYSEHTFYVSGEVAARDQEAGWFYQSQGGDMMLGRIRDYDQLRREVKYREILDWLDYQGWNNKRRATESAAGQNH